MVAGRKHCHFGMGLFCLVPSVAWLEGNEGKAFLMVLRLRELGQDGHSRPRLCLSISSSQLRLGQWFWLTWAILKTVCVQSTEQASVHSSHPLRPPPGIRISSPRSRSNKSVSKPLRLRSKAENKLLGPVYSNPVKVGLEIEGS